MQIENNFVLGCKLSPVDIRDYKIRVGSVMALPESFELSNVPAVKNQKSVSSCVAHALSSVVEYYNIQQLNDKSEMSTGFIYGNRENADDGKGMYPRKALSNLKNYGDCKNEDFPENIEVPEAIDLYEERKETLKDAAYKYRISTYFKVSTADEIKSALMNYGPVAISIPIYSGTKVDSNGIMTATSQTVSGYHMIFIYGWNEDGWKIQNSWGKTWGNFGRAILPYSWKLNEAWGVTDNIIDENDIIVPWYQKLPKVIIKVINFIANIFKKKE